MFIDEVEFSIQAGKGGDGAVSFRRERFVPKGGPDGGDGGKGGDIIFIGKHDLHTLNDLRAKKVFQAENGHDGTHKKMYGRKGQDCMIYVPLGTIISITNETETHVDITTDGQRYTAARGGNGGWGNAHFATSIKQTPQWSKDGLPGERLNVHLELRLIADVGLVGLPNAGKSTLLSMVSNAKPKIADYPFTTLIPQLGVASVDSFHFTIADIPGLIEGAASGKGLGSVFLRHIQRTKLLVFLVDAGDQDPISNLRVLDAELKSFNTVLSTKPRIVVFNKIDTVDHIKLSALKKSNKNSLFISAATGEGVQELLKGIAKRLQ